MDLSHIKTLDSLIEFGRTGDFSIHRLGVLEKDEELDVVYLSDLIYTRYENLLRPRLVKIQYSPSEYIKYRYKPELLSMDIYGTPLLYHMILYFNNVGVHRFNKQYVYLLSKQDIEGIFQDILVKEEKNLKKNHLKVQG